MVGWVIGLVSLYYVIRTNERMIAEEPTIPTETGTVAEGEPSEGELPPSIAEIETLQKVAPAAGPGAGTEQPSPTDCESGESTDPGSENTPENDCLPEAGAAAPAAEEAVSTD